MSTTSPARPVRVLMLSAEYPPQPGGVGDYTARLASELHAQGVAVAVLTGKGDESAASPFPVWRRARGWGRHLRSDVQAGVSEWQADLLHIQYQTGAYGMNPAVNLLPTRLDLPVVVTLHDLRMPYLAPKVAPLRRYVTRLLIESASSVIVTNTEDAARLAGDEVPDYDPDQYALSKPLYPPAQLIPIGSNIPQAGPRAAGATRAELGIASDSTLLGYFGLLNPSKGVRTLLEALAHLPASVQLLLIGGATTNQDEAAYAHELEALIDEYGLAGRIIRTGYAPAEAVSRYIQAVDMMVLPFLDGASYRRGSLLAALAHGAPTITTTPAGTLDPPLRDGLEALLVPVGDPAALASAIQRLSASEHLRQQLGQIGSLLARQFTWDSIASQHRRLYEDVWTP